MKVVIITVVDMMDDEVAKRGEGVCNMSNLLVRDSIRCVLLSLELIQVRKWSWYVVVSGSNP